MESLKRNVIAGLIAFVTFLGGMPIDKAAAKKGTWDSGGGTFVQSPASKRLVFWDLYLGNPNLQDNEPGDRIIFHATDTRTLGEFVDYRKFKSFELLRARLKVWSTRASRLYAALNSDDLFLRNRQCDHCNSRPSYVMPIVGTPFYIKQFDELSVPANLDTTGLRGFPGAFFRPEYEYLVVSAPIFNEAGLYSQAAMLLHERLRFIQIDYALTNADLQRIVYDVMLRSPEDVPEQEYRDSLFGPVNYDPVLRDESVLTQSLTGADRAYQKRIGRFVYQMNHGLLGWAEISKKLDKDGFVSADRWIAKEVDAGILGLSTSPQLKLHSTGMNNSRTYKPRAPIVSAPSTLLTPSTCDSVLKERQDLTMVNTYRPAFSCDSEGLQNVGGLFFETPLTDVLMIEITGRLPSPYDGGANFEVRTLGQKISIHRGVDSFKQVPDPGAFHTWVFRIDYRQGRADIILADGGDWRTGTTVKSVQLKFDMRGLNVIDFEVIDGNWGTIRSIRLL